MRRRGKEAIENSKKYKCKTSTYTIYSCISTLGTNKAILIITNHGHQHGQITDSMVHDISGAQNQDSY